MEEEDKLFDIEASSAFESAAWPTLLQQSMLELTYVWRQADQQLMEMLADLRIGTVSQDLAAFLDERKQHYGDAIRSNDGLIEDATHIFPRTVEVRQHNNMCLSRTECATGRRRTAYTAVDSAVDVARSDLALRKVLDSSLVVPHILELCIGARVAMCSSTKKQNLKRIYWHCGGHCGRQRPSLGGFEGQESASCALCERARHRDHHHYRC